MENNSNYKKRCLHRALTARNIIRTAIEVLQDDYDDSGTIQKVVGDLNNAMDYIVAYEYEVRTWQKKAEEEGINPWKEL